VLRKIRFRLAVSRLTELAALGLFGATAACFLWVILTRLFPALGGPEAICAGLVVTGLLAALAAGLFKRPSLLQAALEGDRRFRLAERLTSSYELADVAHPMVEALHDDARRHLERVRPREAFPLAAGRSLRWGYIPVAVFLLAYLFFPELDLLGYRERQAAAKARQEELRIKAETLRNAAKPIRRIPNPAPEAAANAMEGLERIADDLEANAINEKQALARLTNLARTLEEQRRAFESENPMPKLAADAAALETTEGVAAAIQQKNFGEAAKKLDEIQKKLEQGGLDQEQREALAAEMNALADMMAKSSVAGPLSRQLAEALKNAGQCMCQSGRLGEAIEALQQAQLSLKDLESVMRQLEQMDLLLAECGNCMGCLGGQCPGRYAGIGGRWAEGEGGWGPGMGGPGRGQGGMVGDLPDVDAGLDAALLPGELTKGRILAGILQRGTPDGDATPEREYIAGAFVEVRQQAEQALNKEEIPPGSKEFVRQYFGSLDPTSQPGDAETGTPTQ